MSLFVLFFHLCASPPAPITSETADLIPPSLMERERSHRPRIPAIFMKKQQLDSRETELISY